MLVGLRLRLIAGVLLLNLLVGLLGLAFIHASSKAAHERAATATRNLAELIERDVAGRLDRVEIGMHMLVKQLEHQLDSSGQDGHVVWQMVDDTLALTPDAEVFGIFDAQGRQVCGTKALNCQHLDISDREHFKQARTATLSSSLLSGPLQSRATGRWSLFLSRALRRPDGSFAGLVVAVVPLEAIQKSFASLDLGKHGAVSLRHESLTLLARHPGPMRMAREEDNRKVSPQLAQAVKAAPAGGSYKAPTAIDGIERENAFRHFAKYPLYIIVGLGTADFLNEWQSSLYLTATVGLAFAGATVVLALLVLSTIRRRASGEARLHSVVQAMAEGVILHDREGRVVEANAAAADILGIDREQLLQMQGLKPEWQAVNDDGTPLLAQAHPAQVSLATGRSVHEQVMGLLIDPERGRRWLSVNTQALVEPGGTQPSGVVASITDITERRRAEQQLLAANRQLELLARHDPLTGLCNRRWMGELVQRALIDAQRGNSPLAFVMIDIDHFKRVNDNHGHAAGDAVLVAVADMLRTTCRASDALCRYGGEEFLLLLARTDESGALQRAEHVRQMAQALRIEHEGQALAITVSLGVAVYPAAGGDLEALIAKADHALYEAKRGGRNTVRLAK